MVLAHAQPPAATAGAPASPTADTTPIEQLEDALTELSAHLNAAEHRFLVLLEEFDRRDGHLGEGLKSTAHWLNWKCGIHLGAARERVRVARALPALPAVSNAFACGELSYSKVRAITRVATAHNENYLLMIAQHGTASHLERLVRGYRRATRADEAAAAQEQYAGRELRCYCDDDGSLLIQGRLSPEDGALFMNALNAARDGINTDGTPAGDHSARQADALVRLAETALAHEPTAVAAGERYQVIVHVDADALPVDGDGLRSHIDDGPRVSAETSRRLACDCSRLHVHDNADGEVLNIGRKTRQIPPAIRRALQLRDRGCRFPGCTEHRFVDGHHIRHWADGGDTSLDNLVLLCRHHHRLVHEGGFSVRRVPASADGARTRGQRAAYRMLFATPEGRPLSPAPTFTVPPRDRHGAGLRRLHQRAGLALDTSTAVTRWAGERMDLEMAVSHLLPSAP